MSAQSIGGFFNGKKSRLSINLEMLHLLPSSTGEKLQLSICLHSINYYAVHMVQYSRTNLYLTKLTSSPKGNDRSPENKQVFLNSSLVSKRFIQLVKGSQLCSPWLTKF